ncbi:MAG: acyltransferase family protein [Parvibaculum sp.]|uniref:acyltransferase family protein n=1 Tax=Parvibaculum sp. TaxID=2024848 RepID=UPI0025EAD8C5|nr:acyltransferase family protein [Parvibaculum sp.]MCE9651108.1 acyltransferase family protein [Parvibaculum sp.]
MAPAATPPLAGKRVDWIDAVKGLTIVLVVMKHVTYGEAVVLHQTPYLFNIFCEFTIPFRMPLFFLVAGLFAQKALRAPLRGFIDSKILHFAYFYLLWSAIQIGVKIILPHEGHWDVSYKDLLLIPLEPFGLLWFIYALAVFFALMRFARDVRAPIMIAFALALYFTKLDTGWTMPDEFARRFIFFVSGVYAAPYVFQMANWAIADARRGVSVGLALLVAVGAIVFTGLVDQRAIELLTGFTGAAGTIMLIAVLASKGYAKPLAYIGSRSLYIFLAFFLPMAAARVAMVRLGFENGDLVTLIALISAIAVPLLVFRLTENTPLSFLFKRPDAFRLSRQPSTRELAPAGAAAPIETGHSR